MMASSVSQPGKLIKLPVYFDLVEFDDKQCEISKCEHILFFVTVVAGLRTNMTARIIADRLHDRGVAIDSSRVQRILETHPKLFKISRRAKTVQVGERSFRVSDPLRPDEKAYELTDEAKKKLTKEIDDHWIKLHWWDNWPTVVMAGVLGALVFIGVILGAWQCASAAVESTPQPKVTLVWVLQNVPAVAIWGGFTTLCAVAYCAFIAGIGYERSKPREGLSQ